MRELSNDLDLSVIDGDFFFTHKSTGRCESGEDEGDEGDRQVTA